MTLSAPLPAESEKYTGRIITVGFFFFIFGFITWVNGTLIPYFRIACELEEWQAYLVTFAFYISYTVMAIPSSKLLTRTGMVNGMRIGLVVMAPWLPALCTGGNDSFLSPFPARAICCRRGYNTAANSCQPLHYPAGTTRKCCPADQHHGNL